MNNNLPPYKFTASQKFMWDVRPQTEGHFQEIFENHTFTGGLERIVLEFSILTSEPKPGLATPEIGSARVPSFLYMPIVYKAYEKPKKVLIFKTNRVVAFSSLNMTPKDFEKQLTAEQYVDFVVGEAEVLAKAFGLPVEIVYHGDPFYARKYLPQKQP